MACRICPSAVITALAGASNSSLNRNEFPIDNNIALSKFSNVQAANYPKQHQTNPPQIALPALPTACSNVFANLLFSGGKLRPPARTDTNMTISVCGFLCTRYGPRTE